MTSTPTMRAVVWEAPEELKLVEIAKPTIVGPEDVVLQTECASTCGTDLHIYRGAIPGFIPGTVIGHEFIGRIEQVGSAVKRFEPGQRVRCSDFFVCGSCAQCMNGHHSQCKQRRLFGFSGIQAKLDGGLAEFVHIPCADTVLDPLSESVDARAALLAADVLPTAMGALERCKLSTEKQIAIVGAGPVGLLTALLARHYGCHPVLLETSDYRAARAHDTGIETLKLPVDTTVIEAFPEITGAFDVAIDAVGGERGLAAALALVRRGGRIVGVGSQAHSYAVNWGEIFQRELTLHFALGNAIRMRNNMDTILIECQPFLDAMFSDEISLASVPNYYPSLFKREKFKAVINIAGR